MTTSHVDLPRKLRLLSVPADRPDVGPHVSLATTRRLDQANHGRVQKMRLSWTWHSHREDESGEAREQLILGRF